MKKAIVVTTVIIALITLSCDTVDTSFEDALPERSTLSTTVIPAGAGTVEPSGGTFPLNSTITIRAIPADGYIFQNWEGDITGTANPRQLFLSDSRNVVAQFISREYPLNIEIVGEGTVSEEIVSPSQTNQSASGQAGKPQAQSSVSSGGQEIIQPGSRLVENPDGGTTNTILGDSPVLSQGTSSSEIQSVIQSVTIRLTANPAEGWIFDRWEGDLTGSDNPETIVVDEEKNVTAVFVEADPDMFTLQVQVQGEGTVTVDPNQNQFDDGAQVTLTAAASSGWSFSGWQGAVSGTQNPATLIMDSDKNVTAIFTQDEPEQYSLEIQIEGEGTVSADPSGDVYDEGTQVSLTASAASGWRFAGWQGDLSGSRNPASLVMDSDKNVTAVFVERDPDLFTLTVQVQGEGSVTREPSQDEYEDGDEVSLTAVPESGWSFSGWQGDLSGSSNPATLVMDDDKNVTAVFEQDAPEQYSLQVQVQGEGSVSVNPSQDEYDDGTEVRLTASAAAGWRFSGWQGDLSGSSNPATLVMNEDKNVTAVFVEREPDMYTLEVQVQGQGSVSRNPSQDEFEDGTEVTLTATAASGWIFSGWQGDLSGSENPATVIMDSDKNVTAVFEEIPPEEFTLQIQVQGEGSVSRSPSQDDYVDGTEVTLTATPASGWSFSGWQGDLSGSENPATLVMDSDKNVTAVFEEIPPEQFTLQVNVQGEGSVSVDPSQDEYEEGTEVILSATPSLGWRFIRWQGDLSGNSNPATIVMDEDKEVTAVFQQIGPSILGLLNEPSQTTAGSPVSPSPQLNLRNDLGVPISGSQIRVSLNNGSFLSGSTTTATTNSEGNAIFNQLLIATAAAGYRLTFTTDGPGVVPVESGNFEVVAAEPDASNSSADVPDGRAGEQTTITIEVQDRFDNPAGTSNQLSVVVSGSNSTTPAVETVEKGVYTATYTPVNVGADQVAVNLNGSAISGSPFTSSVSAGLAAEITRISGNNQTGQITRALSEPFVVRVFDSAGNPVPGQDVEFNIVGTPPVTTGQSMSESEVITDSDGYASSVLTLGVFPGEYVVEASAGDAGSVRFTATATLLPPSSLQIEQQPATTVAGETVSPAPAVRANNELGNPVEDVEIEVNLNGGNFEAGSTSRVTGEDGIAVFDDLVITAAGTGYTLAFSVDVSGVSSVNSQSFNVVAAAGDPDESSADVPDGTAGEQTRIIIAVEDEFGNPVSNVNNLTVTVSGSNTAAVSPTGTNTPGEYLAVYTPETAGEDEIAIRLGGEDIDDSPFTSEVSAAAVDPSASTVSASPAQLYTGESSEVTVRLMDRFGNPVTGLSDSDFQISLTGASASAGQVSETSVSGTYEFNVTKSTSGQVQVTVGANGINLNQRPVITFEIDLSTTSMKIHEQPKDSKAGQPIEGPPGVQILDKFDNPAPGIDVTVRERRGETFASGTLTVATNLNGIASFSDLVINAVGNGFQLEFSAAGVGSVNSNAFKIDRGR